MASVRHFPKWVAAVLRHWYGWVGGTALAVLLLFGQELFGWQPTRWQFAGILSLGLFWSMFTAWSDEHEARLEANALLGDLPPHRPVVAPHEYGQGERSIRFGLTIANDRYPAYEVSIPDVPIGNTGQRLTFKGELPRLVEKDGKQFVEAWIENSNGSTSRPGDSLHGSMSEGDLRALPFTIVYKDSDLRWYKSNCLIERTHSRKLGVKFVDQELISKRATAPASEEVKRHQSNTRNAAGKTLKILSFVGFLISVAGLSAFYPRLSATQATPDPTSSHDELSSSQFAINNGSRFRVSDVVSACYIGRSEETSDSVSGPRVHLSDALAVVVRPPNDRLLSEESLTVPCTSKNFFGMPVTIKTADLAIVAYYRPWPFTIFRLRRLFRFVARRGDKGQLVWDKQPSQPLELAFDKWLARNGGEFPPTH